jgi:purine-binding chemotaxis protein CheW
LNTPSQTHENPATSGRSSQSIELLTFIFNEVIFAIDILLVEEIHGYVNLVSKIDAASSINSVISVRGSPVQMIDLGVMFGLNPAHNSCPKNIIILNLHDRQFGITIDGVTEVITTDRSLLTPPIQTESSLSWHRYSAGLIKVDHHLLVVLDLEKLVSHHNLIVVGGLHGE